VIALQKNLVAAADAHHLVADLVEARRWISGAKEDEEGGAEENRLCRFAASCVTRGQT